MFNLYYDITSYPSQQREAITDAAQRYAPSRATLHTLQLTDEGTGVLGYEVNLDDFNELDDTELYEFLTGLEVEFDKSDDADEADADDE